MRYTPLARISHQLSAAADDALHPAVLSHLGVLTAEPKAEGRKPRSGASERTVKYASAPLGSKTQLGTAPRQPRYETR
jgi:hypothetical protein